MSFQDAMLEGMADYLREQVVLDVKEVTSYEEDLPSSSHCETCGPDPIMVHIYYNDTKGEANVYSYYGGFAEFIRSIS